MIRESTSCNGHEPSSRRALRYLLAGVVLLCALATARAEETETARDASWYLQGGGYIHYSDDEDYEGPPWFLGIERHRPGKAIIGLSVFNNSFGQFTQYAYLAKAFHPFERAPNIRLKITGGIAHGYKGEHQDTSPINWGDGWAFAIVPAIGYQKDRLGLDVALLSNSGLLFLVGVEF
jgi:hypothetical protein